MSNLILNQNGMNTVSQESREGLNVLTQTQAHPSRSSKYSVVTSMNVIKMFEDAGFTWKLVRQEKCRGHYANYGTHLIALEHPEIRFSDEALNKEIIPRLFFSNSYHGRTRLKLDLGIFRTYCENGLFIGTMLETFSKKHIGITPDKMPQVVLEMKRVFAEKVVPLVTTLMEKEMTESQQLAFAKAVLAERLSDNDSYIGGEHEKLLIGHRDEDKGNSTWKVLNRVQENLGLNFRSSPVEIQYRYQSQDENGLSIIKERKVSKLSNIQQVTYLNKYLFDKIMEMNQTTSQVSEKIAA